MPPTVSYNHGYNITGWWEKFGHLPPARRRPETTVPGPLVGAVEQSRGTFSHSDPTAAPNRTVALHIPPRAYDRRPLFAVLSPHRRSVCASVIPCVRCSPGVEHDNIVENEIVKNVINNNITCV